MPIVFRRLAIGLGLGTIMCLAVWLFSNESSPAYSYLNEDPEAGYGLLILNLPALFISRLISGTPPAEVAVYVLCFIQWFAIGVALSFIIWRGAAQPGAPADVGRH